MTPITLFNHLKYKLLLLLLLLIPSGGGVFGETITFSDLGYTNSTNLVGKMIQGDSCSISFVKGTGGTSPTYYTDGAAARAYSGNKFTVSSNSSIWKIKITFGKSDGSNVITTDVGTYSNGTWTGSANSVTFTIGGTSGNRRISSIRVWYRKPQSDIAKTDDITLDFRDDAVSIDLTDYYTTSSTGLITYSVADESIVSVEGSTLTALAVGETTVTVSQDSDATYDSGSVDINVTVQDTRTACSTIPAISISTLTEGDADGTISVVNPVKADEGTTFTFTSSDTDVLSIDGTTYSVGEAGTATITVTATPSDNTNYKAVTETFLVTVNTASKGDITIVPSFASYTTVYGTDLVGSVSVTDEDDVRDYGGTVTAVSSNTAVATVAIDDGVVTVTPVAVGTATITFSAAETTYFNAATDETIDITVTAPAGQTTVDLENVVFYESFDESTGTEGWSGSAGSGTAKYDNKGWTGSSVSGNGGSLKLGTTSDQGYVITPQIGSAGNFTITFRAGAWSGDKTTDALVLSIEAGSGTLSQTTFTLKSYKWSDYSLTITGATADTKIKFSAAQASNNRFNLDSVRVFEPGVSTISGKLNASGYGTICSEYPLTFSSGDDFSAWQITAIDGDVITFSQVDGGVVGGTGLFLKGRNGKTGAITLNCADSETALPDNLLVGTIVPTYVEADTYYGLSGSNFVRVAASTVPAGKALISVDDIGDTGAIKAFTLVFNEATGVSTIVRLPSEQVRELFSLSGIRLAKPQSGINIIDGRKVIIQ